MKRPECANQLSILHCSKVSKALDDSVHDTFEPVHVRYQKLECTYSKYSDPPAHPHSLIRVLVFRLRKLGPLTIHRAPIKYSDQTARMQKGFSEFSLVAHVSSILIKLYFSLLKEHLFKPVSQQSYDRLALRFSAVVRPLSRPQTILHTSCGFSRNLRQLYDGRTIVLRSRARLSQDGHADLQDCRKCGSASVVRTRGFISSCTFCSILAAAVQ